MKRKDSDVTTIVIHCADTPDGLDKYGIHDVDDWHRERGFLRDSAMVDAAHSYRHVGYHEVIHVDGSVHYGRRFDEVGAHAPDPYNLDWYPGNAGSYGICMIGRRRFTREQWVTLGDRVRALLRDHAQLVYVVGHRDVEPRKECPGFSVGDWMHRGMVPDLGWICPIIQSHALPSRPVPIVR